MDDIKTARSQRRDFRNEIIKPPDQHTSTSQPSPVPRPTKPSKKKTLTLLILVLIMVIGVAGGWLHWHHTSSGPPKMTSPVPAAITQAVNFPIYYPDSQKLPKGYTFSSNSFKYVAGQGILYYVKYGNGKKLVFTLQPKPSSGELANFNKQYIPIHRQVLTLVGTAIVGGIGNQTVVSLPTSGSTWIIITGPSDIYATDQLTQVIQSIKKAD